MSYEILTEENPQVPEVTYILKEIGLPHDNVTMELCLDGNKWINNCAWVILNHGQALPVTLRLFRGTGSSVDYIVKKEGEIIIGLESTKTTDKDSRNTSVNQRFTKFVVFKQMYKDAKMILYYNNKQNHTTDTGKLGLRMFKTQGVHVTDSTGRDLLSDCPSFSTVDEILQAKNNIKEKKGNVSIKITKLADHTYGITARLSKGIGTSINSDPNIGCIVGLCATIYSLDSSASFVIQNHRVKLEGLTNKSKFWYANSSWPLKLEGSEVNSKGCKSPENPYRENTMSESHSTILFEQLVKKKNNFKVLFHQHACSAKSSFILADGSEACVPKEITIPDIVFLDSTNKTVFVVEGKIMKDIKKGDAQLDNLKKFDEFVLSKYSGHTIKKGLCIYTEGKTLPATKYPVWFSLDSEGKFTMDF